MMNARSLLLVLAVMLASGCVSASRTAAPREVPIETRARAVKVFTGDGEPIAWEALVAHAADAQAVIIGENHGHERGLAFASELWSDILARRSQAALSMEFFYRDEQALVDDYTTGLIDESAFRKAGGREDDAKYPPGHRAMVNAAKAAGRPVIASNAPRVYVRTASRQSYDALAALSEEQRRLFCIPESLPTGRYRADFDAQMSNPAIGAHAADPADAEAARARLDASFRAQSLWDWTMAESIARAMDRGSPVVHVAGRFHSDFAGGLIEALRAKKPGARIVTISVINAWSDTFRDEDHGRADAVVYVGE